MCVRVRVWRRERTLIFSKVCILFHSVVIITHHILADKVAEAKCVRAASFRLHRGLFLKNKGISSEEEKNICISTEAALNVFLRKHTGQKEANTIEQSCVRRPKKQTPVVPVCLTWTRKEKLVRATVISSWVGNLAGNYSLANVPYCRGNMCYLTNRGT